MTLPPEFRDLRMPFEYKNMQLARQRTLASAFLQVRLEVPDCLKPSVSQLLEDEHRELFPQDATESLSRHRYPDLQLPSSAEVTAALARQLQDNDLLLESGPSRFGYAVCREVPFHSDDYYVESQAYGAWVLATTGPLAFHSCGRAVPVVAGDLLVFDAVRPHALLRAGAQTFTPYPETDYSHRMVFALGSFKLTPALRQALGIQVTAVRSNSRGQLIRRVDVCERTGVLTG